MIDHEQVRELLTTLVDLSESDREQRLAELSSSNPVLHTEILSLLPFTQGDRDELDRDPFIGEVVGQFTILERIGSGGMGRVYKARQENPPRDVAFKILRRGLLSRNAAKRFEIECLTLPPKTSPFLMR